MPSVPAAEIARLREEIERHDQKYYVEAAPEISDLDYDQLIDRLKTLESEHPELITPDSPTQRIGDRPVEGLEPFEHRVPMLSVENTYSLDELKKYGQRVAKLLPDEPIEWVVELKVDGVAVSLIYEEGFLTHGVDRGDGHTGTDITHNVRTIKDIPLRLLASSPLSLRERARVRAVSEKDTEAVPPLLEVRGEIYMTNSDLVQFNDIQRARIEKGDKKAQILKNTRNGVAGSVHQRDSRVCDERHLRFFCHSVGDTTGLKAKTHIEFLHEMAAFGFSPTPHVECFSSFIAAVEYCEELIERLHELDFEIDGLVLKVNRFDQRERLGSTSKSPRWVIAYKFEKYEAITRLNDIRVQVGKTGTITPVADLEPVELAGTTVSRASLHNADEIERKDVRIGDVVVVEKAGKVIPHIVRVERDQRKRSLKKFVFPTECPECGQRLVYQKRKPKRKTDAPGEHIYCPNFECPARIRARIRYFAGRSAMDIEELGVEIISSLVGAGLVRNYDDLYRLKHEHLVDRLSYKTFGTEKATAIIEAANESKNKGLAHLLYGLAIPYIGGLQAVRVAEVFQTMDGLLAADCASLAKVREVGQILAQIIFDCIHDDFLLRSIQELKCAGVVMEVVKSSDVATLKKKKVPRIANEGYDSEGLKKRLGHFVSKEAMDIKGLGGTTLSALVDEGMVCNYGDLYHLQPDQLSALQTPMRDKEAQNLLLAIAKSKDRGLVRLLNALSIRSIGSRMAAILGEIFGSIDNLMKASTEDIERALRSRRQIKKKKTGKRKTPEKRETGIIAKNFYQFLHSDIGRKTIHDLAHLGVKMTTLQVSPVEGRKLEGKTLVVTGTLTKFTRDEIQELITRHGGHAASSISKNTDYLVAGENAGSKLTKAQELNVPVISEEQFELLIG